MNIIKLKVNFEKRTCIKTGVSLTSGDFNSTKIVFDFNTEEGTKVFEMNNPSGELCFLGEVIDHEIILVGKADVTTTHNDKKYIKYIKNDNVFWYQKDDDELFNDNWVEVTPFDLTEYTKVQKDCTLFGEAGRYPFEVSLYDGDSKLTSAKGNLKAEAQAVEVGDEVVSGNLPLFDDVMMQLNDALDATDNLSIEASKSGGTETVIITDKDGTQHTTYIYDGEDGVGLDYNWSGTSLGVKREDETNYQYVNLKGEKGDPGAVKFLIVESLPTTGIEEDTIYLVPITPDAQQNNYEEYIYVNGQWELLGKIAVHVDLTDYVKNTDYATTTKGGVIISGYHQFNVSDGHPFASNANYSAYQNMGEYSFISKGTLENVITGKSLETATNKVTSISSSSTDTQYPSAKAVYTLFNSLENLNEVNF